MAAHFLRKSVGTLVKAAVGSPDTALVTGGGATLSTASASALASAEVEAHVDALLERIASGVLSTDRRNALLELRLAAGDGGAAVIAIGTVGLPVLTDCLREDDEFTALSLDVLLVALGDGSEEGAVAAELLSRRPETIASLLTAASEGHSSALEVLSATAQRGVEAAQRVRGAAIGAALWLHKLVDFLDISPSSRGQEHSSALARRTSTLNFLRILCEGQGGGDVRRLLVFEGICEKLLTVILSEGGIGGSETVEDCLRLLAALLRGEDEHQKLFLEANLVRHLLPLISVDTLPPPYRQYLANLLAAADLLTVLLTPGAEKDNKTVLDNASALLALPDFIENMISISLSPGGAAVVPPPLRASMTNALSLIVYYGGTRAQTALENATLAFPGMTRAPPVDALNCAITLAFIGSTATAASAHNLLVAFTRESSNRRSKLADMVPMQIPEEEAENPFGIEQCFGIAIVRELKKGEPKGAAMAALILRQIHDGLSADQCAQLAKMLTSRLVKSASDISSQIACIRCLIAVGDRAHARLISDGPSMQIFMTVAKRTTADDALSSQLASVLIGLLVLWTHSSQPSTESSGGSLRKRIESELGTQNLLTSWSAFQDRLRLQHPAPPPGPPPPVTDSSTNTDISIAWLEIVVLDSDLHELIHTIYPRVKALFTSSSINTPSVEKEPLMDQAILVQRQNDRIQPKPQIATEEVQSMKIKMEESARAHQAEVQSLSAQILSLKGTLAARESELEALSATYNTVEEMLSKTQEERDLYRRQLVASQAAVENAEAKAAKVQQDAETANASSNIPQRADENSGDDELNDLLICLGQEEDKVAFLTEKLETFGVDVGALLETLAADDEPDESDDEE